MTPINFDNLEELLLNVLGGEVQLIDNEHHSIEISSGKLWS